jgi:hypothetical protein
MLVTELHFVKVGLNGRRGPALDSVSLDPRSQHDLGQIITSSKEELVVVATAITGGSQAQKAIEVQLALEGGQLGLTKVSADKNNRKLVLVRSIGSVAVRAAMGATRSQVKEPKDTYLGIISSTNSFGW